MPPAAATDRRQLLRLAAASAAAGWWPRSAWSQPPLAENPFLLGVASGSPAADSVVLWTRLVAPGLRELAAGAVTVGWEVAHDEGFREIVRSGQAQALPELAHAVHVEADGLAPDRWYHYRFHVGAWRSPVGRTRTWPQPGAAMARLRLGFASCQRWEHGWYAAWRHLRAEAPDAVVFLGDYIYEYPSAFGAVRVPDGQWATTLAEYRARHALHKSDADLQAMHAACPWLLTWDDHEVQNDYAGAAPGNAGPAITDFAARRAAAYQAYYEHMPLRAGVLARALQGLREGAELRLYGRHRIGGLVDLCLLDNRQYRDVQACTRGGRHGSSTVDPKDCAAWADPARTLLGAEQERWLGRQVAEPGATWTVLGQGTLFGARDLKPGPGETYWNDGWDGYAASRQRLVEALRGGRATNPVLLGGDVHENWVGHVKADYARPDSANVGVEFCGTSITSRAGTGDATPARLAENPHFIHARADERGYGVADFLPSRLEVRLRTLDDVTRPDAEVRTQAAFVVQAGRPVVERA
ncbi:alkaline phosphatase [Ramlibacter sp.]|uniref:alkaline phosphatase D family protein n=1 Tax=Ramlibacter sp. TaxID=1917967 RepID=UPI0035B37A6B